MKFRVDDFGQVESRLDERGLSAESSALQVDCYLSHPSRDFAKSHEALRLRRIGDENRITYKGPRLHGPTKTREEIEIALAGGDQAFEDFERMLKHLGFQAVATIRKLRRTYRWSREGVALEILLDDADGLGQFVEIEALAASEAGLAEAQAAVLAAAQELGLDRVETRSYLRMHIEARQRPSGDAGSPR